MNKKIGLLIETLNGGGAERSAGLISTILTDLGCQVFIITLFDDIAYTYSGELINLGLYKKGSRSVLNKFLRYKELNAKIKEHNLDLILDFRMKNYPLRELLLNTLIFRTKMINMVRSFNLKGYFPIPKIFSKYLYKNYAGINTVSVDIEQEIKKIYDFSNVFTIHNPVDIDFINEEASKKKLIKEIYIVALGSLYPVKQIDKLIKAYNNTILPEQNIKLYIIGSGPEKDLVTKIVDDLGLQTKVELLPFQENPFSYLAQAKFLVLSSKYEGFPRVLVESLACSTPVVSFNCKSGPNEIIEHQKNGLLVEDQNFQELTNAMNEFVTNELLYNTCKKNSLRSIEPFAMSAISDNWRKYLKEIFQLD